MILLFCDDMIPNSCAHFPVDGKGL